MYIRIYTEFSTIHTTRLAHSHSPNMYNIIIMYVCRAHKPVLAGSLCQPVLSCPGRVHDAKIARHWLLLEATPASQVTLHHCTAGTTSSQYKIEKNAMIDSTRGSNVEQSISTLAPYTKDE